MLASRMMRSELSIIEILRHAADAFPDTEIVSRMGDGATRRHSYEEALHRSAQLAHALIGLGVRRGDRIATLAWNNFRHFELYYGVSGIGAVCHTINPRLFEEQLSYIARHAGDTLLFVEPGLLPVAEKIASDCPGIRRFIILCDRGEMPSDWRSDALCYEELLDGQPTRFDWPLLDENSAAAMCYTSGTTGNPKGVLYSHRTTVLHALGMLGACVLPYGIGATVMPVVPMFHVQAWGQPYVAPIAGSKLVLPGPRLDGRSLAELIEAEDVSIALGVPTVWLGLLSYMRDAQISSTRLKHVVVGGAAAPVSLIKALEEELGVNVIHGWGMTETSPVCACGVEGRLLDEAQGDERYRLKTHQRRFFGVEFRLAGQDGSDVPCDGKSTGELQCRGHWIADGYFDDEAATASAMTEDGWFRTGDVATVGREGLLRITDRTKDMIKSGGEWISSIDLEDAVMSHPDVAEAAAIAVPHPKWQERPMMIVVPKPGSSLDADGIREHLKDRIASWWMPDEIIVTGQLPHTATGKVSKLTLREMHSRGELSYG